MLKKNCIWIILVNKMDELLFSVYVVKTGNWYVSMKKTNKILKQGINSGEKMVVLLQQDCWPGGSPSQASGGCSFSHPWWVKAIWGHRYPTVVIAGFMNIELQRTSCPTEKIFILCYQNTYMGWKYPKVLGMKCSLSRPEHTSPWERAMPVQSTHSLLPAGTASRPRQHWTSDASFQAIGFLKVLS